MASIINWAGIQLREENELSIREIIFSVSVGPSLFSETILVDRYRKVSVGADLSFGRWFTSASGMEIGLGYDFIAPHTSKTLCLGTAHVDYLLNLTSLLEPDPDRRFHLIASLGTGIGWSNYNSDGGIGWVVEGGLQFRWNVSPFVRSFCGTLDDVVGR